MKIAIVNQPLGNRGDEAAHRAFIRSLLKEFPESIIDVIFLNQDDSLINDFIVNANNVRYINLTGVRKASGKCMTLTMIRNNLFYSLIHPFLQKYVSIIKNYDLVICAPGGICMGGFMNWNHIWAIYVPILLGKDVYYWGRSIGPFSTIDKSHKLFKEISEKLIGSFKYISLRDEISYDMAKSINSKSTKTMDTAFLETPIAKIPNEIGEMLTNDYIVFVPNELLWHYKFKNVCKTDIDSFYLEIINVLIKKFPTRRLIMLPQTFKNTAKDYQYFCELRDKLRNDNIIVIDENQSSDIQQAIIKGASLVVGARYHSIVFAINNSIPFISLSYEHKMTGLLKMLGLDNMEINIEKVFILKEETIDSAVKHFETILEQLTSITNETSFAKEYTKSAFRGMVAEIKKQNAIESN